MERKKRGWFERIKRLFVSEPKLKPKPEKKVKSKRWMFVGKLKTQNSFALPAPEPAAPPVEEEQIRQAEDEQSKHAMAVALATAAAAEAAVAAAHAAAEVVRLTGKPAALAGAQATTPTSHEHAALMIQSVYRGYLARRALRALKGLVRLQALIRGQAVRRQTAATLRGLESLMKIQARQRARASSAAADHHLAAPPPAADGMDALLRRGRELYYAAAVHEQQQSKGWVSSTLSKEEMSAMSRSREEAALKRVRALQYASLQNEKIGTRRQPMNREEMETLNQRWSWLEEWVGSQPFDKDIPVAHQSPSRDGADADDHPPQPATVLRSRSRADRLACPDDDDVDRQLGYSARRSFTRAGRRTPARDDDDAAAAFPGYMASTASAKAKFRSMSTPKERSGGAADAYSEQCFPFADRLLSPIPSMSPIPSIASDIVFARSSRPAAAQRSPRVKGPMTPTRSRSRRSPGRHSFGSEAALHQLQMEQYTPIR
ncbi:hypothetical protein E2562_023269 [Oryza meyeriana var. granulata]|uniref:DUF4005 domain-containing protein n=1 Tax=Oryza meyeriana var. granulata TaxID=110450 RepID=A0A6G1DLL9_9ORYZ|nr:hypothetical protein E2562_023269 [Oryza meyeriana var. granulata]KAF0913529.1 hypothetical protein E2562_023269 [Oryza meyeriana var. granulata]